MDTPSSETAASPARAVDASPALGPRPSQGVRGPPVDRSTVELTRRLLALAPLQGGEAAAERFVARVETATLKLKKTKAMKGGKRPFKSGGRGGRGGRGAKGGRGAASYAARSR